MASTTLLATPTGWAQSTEPAPRHHLSAFIGGTALPAQDHHDDEHAATFGIDYEYMLGTRFGMGFVGEHSVAPLDITSLFAVADLHITRGWVLQFGPGYEHDAEHDAAAMRIGTYFEFESADDTVAPAVFYDVSEVHDSVVYGLFLGHRF